MIVKVLLIEKFKFYVAEMEKNFKVINASCTIMKNSTNLNIEKIQLSVIEFHYQKLKKIRPEYEEFVRMYHDTVFGANPKMESESLTDTAYQAMEDLLLALEDKMSMAEKLMEQRKQEEKAREKKYFEEIFFAVLAVMHVIPLSLFLKNL